MPDHALREALRHLQLSPKIIDESMAAIYQHARNPSGHPVDKDLARLCTSEYDRGALCALASYIAASASLHSLRNNTRFMNSAIKSAAEQDATNEINKLPYECSSPPRTDSWARQGVFFGSERKQEKGTCEESITVRIRLRRARSMPPCQHSVDCRNQSTMYPLAPENVNLSRPQGYPVAGTSAAPRRPDDETGVIPMESPRSRKDHEESPARRAPVRTGHWKLGHEIGKGSFGVVHIGLNEDSGDLIAVKVLSLPHADAVEPLYREIELMRQLTHPNIVCYLGAEVNDSEKTISIFQEWVPGSVTTLLVNFGPFSDKRIACYTRQLLHGLKYLHDERVVHRDIKGGNILIDNRGVVKLCDFGASKMLDHDALTGVGDHTRVGSPLFMAPEILLREDYGPPVDIWSVGGAVLEMATGHPPWHTLHLRTPVALINWVKNTDGPPPLPTELSESLRKFLLRCFQRDPTKRATATELLADPFLEASGDVDGSESSTSGSEEDAVSDINNLSRAAAIARIRRASLSDFSRSPRGGTSHQLSPCARMSPNANSGRRHSGGNVIALRREGESPRTKYSGRAIVPSLEVATSGLESPTPCVITPRMATPPRRKSSGVRGGSTSPNPFGRRRRSIDSDTSRSPRHSSTSSPSVSAVSNTSVRPTSPTRYGMENEQGIQNSPGSCSSCSRVSGYVGERGDLESRTARLLSPSVNTNESPSEIALDDIAESASRMTDGLEELNRSPEIGWSSSCRNCRSSSSASSMSSSSYHLVHKMDDESLAVASHPPESARQKSDETSDTAKEQVSSGMRRRRFGRGERPGAVRPAELMDVCGGATCSGEGR